MSRRGPTGPGNPAAPKSPVSFDLSAHLAGVLLYALEAPEHAPALGWLVAYAVKNRTKVNLAALSVAQAHLPDGPWKGGDPRALLAAIPVFGIEKDEAILTEPQELMGIDWSAGNHQLVLFEAMSDRLPFITERANRYWEVVQDWYSTPMPEPGLEKVLRQYAALYNVGLYNEAYKLLEMRWMVEQGKKRDLLRGFMQLAVGLHQIEGGKFAMEQLEEAYGHLRSNRDVFPFPTADRFIKRLEKAARLFKSYGPDNFQKFDLRMFPKIWFTSPWKSLFGLGK